MTSTSPALSSNSVLKKQKEVSTDAKKSSSTGLTTYFWREQYFAQLWPGYKYDTPNKMHCLNYNNTYKNVLKYQDHGNAKKLDCYPELVEK
jgi:hypothetical protein